MYINVKFKNLKVFYLFSFYELSFLFKNLHIIIYLKEIFSFKIIFIGIFYFDKPLFLNKFLGLFKFKFADFEFEFLIFP